MNWEDYLENLESDVEKNYSSENMESSINDTSEQENQIEGTLINDIEQLRNQIEDSMASFGALEELRGIGEDISEAFEICCERLKYLIELGIEKFGMSEEEAQEYYSRAGIGEQSQKTSERSMR